MTSIGEGQVPTIDRATRLSAGARVAESVRMRKQLPLLLLFTACATNAQQDQTAADLEQVNGGYTMTDEAPMFGAQTEFDAAAIEPDTQVTDAMASDPTIATMDNSTTADGRDVLIVWGRSPGDPLAQQGRDWSGSITASRGGLIVRRTIAFENGDHLLPRTAIDAVGFQSYTKPFADGLALRVLDPDPAAATPLSLTYTSSVDTSITYSFDLAQLAAGPVVIDAGDGFKIVAVAQHKHDTDGCVGGFMRGRFHALTARFGVYHGIVTNRLGAPVGHVRGLYGLKKDGTPVMFGKFIDAQGAFVGVLAGTYGNGDFAAKWKILGDDDHGRIRGKYFESPNADGGMFVARWAQTQCSEDTN